MLCLYIMVILTISKPLMSSVKDIFIALHRANTESLRFSLVYIFSVLNQKAELRIQIHSVRNRRS